MKQKTVLFDVEPSIKKIGKTYGIKDKIFPPEFYAYIIGKPSSGKTTYLQYLIDVHFKDKFDYIFIMSGNVNEYKLKKISIEDDNMKDGLDMDWLFGKLDNLNKFYSKKKRRPYINVLIVVDDLINEIKSDKENIVNMRRLVFNRRHLLQEYGMVSIIVASQTYKLLPSPLRSNVSMVFLFTNGLASNEIDKIYNEYISIEKDDWHKLCKNVAKIKYNFLIIDTNKGTIESNK
jgi:GTPase SAR1 family protein